MKSKKDIINEVLLNLKNLDKDDFLNFFEEFKEEYKVIIRKEKLKQLKK